MAKSRRTVTCAVFEGAGFNAASHVGGLKAFNKEGLLDKLMRVGGSSSGSLVAMMVAIGYTPEGMEKVLRDTNFGQLLDESCWISNVHRAATQYGWNKGKALTKAIRKIIKDKTENADLTFAQLQKLKLNDDKDNKGLKQYKDLYVVVHNLSLNRSETWSHESMYKNTSIADAVRASMASPFLFPPVTKVIPLWDPKQGKNVMMACKYDDGGLSCNYPIQMFDKKKYISAADYKEVSEGEKQQFNEEVVGFRSDSQRDLKIIFKGKFKDEKENVRTTVEDHVKISSVVDYTKQNIRGALCAQKAALSRNQKDLDRTVFANTGKMEPFDPKMTQAKLTTLLSSGEAAAQIFLRPTPGVLPVLFYSRVKPAGKKEDYQKRKNCACTIL